MLGGKSGKCLGTSVHLILEGVQLGLDLAEGGTKLVWSAGHKEATRVEDVEEPQPNL